MFVTIADIVFSLWLLLGLVLALGGCETAAPAQVEQPAAWRFQDGALLSCDYLEATPCGLHLWGCSGDEPSEYTCVSGVTYMGAIDLD